MPNYIIFRRSAAEIRGGGGGIHPPPRLWDGVKRPGFFRVKWRYVIIIALFLTIQYFQVEDAKKKTVISPRGAATFYNSLPQNQQFSLVALQASAGSQGFHFQLGQQNNQSGVYIHSCMPTGVMRVGDRWGFSSVYEFGDVDLGFTWLIRTQDAWEHSDLTLGGGGTLPSPILENFEFRRK